MKISGIDWKFFVPESSNVVSLVNVHKKIFEILQKLYKLPTTQSLFKLLKKNLGGFSLRTVNIQSIIKVLSILFTQSD